MGRDGEVVDDPIQRPHEALGRSSRDVINLVVGLGLVVVGFLAATVPANSIERAIYEDINLLPGWSRPVSDVIVILCSPIAIAICAGVAFFSRRIRLGVRLVVAGSLAWVVADLSKHVIGGRAATVRFGGVHHLIHTVFPSDHMAVITAVVTLASPYLPKVARRLSIPILVVFGLALEFTGHQLSLNIATGALEGWCTALGLHIVSGAPGRSVSTKAVRTALVHSGLEPKEIKVVNRRLIGPRIYEVTDHDGQETLVKMVRRGQRRAGWTYRARRLLASLDVENDAVLSSPRHEVDHEAFVTLLAERAGVRTPAVVMATELGHGPALLLYQKVYGHRLDALGPTTCTDGVLYELWRQVRLLGSARIAHHDLRAHNVLVDEEGRPWLLAFTFARSAASPSLVAQDIAEMLVSVASVVGAKRAISTAVEVIGREDLRAALSFLQPLALPAGIREQMIRKRADLMQLADSLAESVGDARPSFRPRVRARAVLSLGVLGLGVYLLLPQLGNLPDLVSAVKHADYWWMAASFVSGLITFPMAAASLMGAVREHIPAIKTTGVQLATAFTSRFTPGGIGGMGLNLIYLEREGNDRVDAIGSVALNQAAGVVVHALLFVAAVAILGTSGLLSNVKLPAGWPVLVAVVGVLILAGVVVTYRFGIDLVLEPAKRVSSNLLRVLRHPGKASALFLGSFGVTVFNALALVASLLAFDSHVPVLSVMAVYVGGAAIASAAPTPGNLGAVEAALVAGLTGIGVRPEPAVAAVLAFRLVTFWIPIIPGVAALRVLQYRKIV